MIERSARPWTEAELCAPALVVAPHPDDETLGCGATIAAKRRAGAPLEIVFLTDGTASHRRFIPAPELRALRRDEALAAAGVLGVDPAAVHFFDFPDGQLARHRRAAADRLRAFLVERRVQQLFVPLRRDWPGDHDMANRIFRDASAGMALSCDVFEYPVWFWMRWPWVPKTSRGMRRWLAKTRDHALWRSALRYRLRAYLADRAAYGAKREALRQHRTQMERRGNEPSWRTLADMGEGEFLPAITQELELFGHWRS